MLLICSQPIGRVDFSPCFAYHFLLVWRFFRTKNQFSFQSHEKKEYFQAFCGSELIWLLFCRYLKSQFTKCEETIILDVLAMVENNVQKASEQLTRMGYEKKEMTPAPRLSHRKLQENQPKKEAAQPTPPPKPKTADEKKKSESKPTGISDFS